MEKSESPILAIRVSQQLLDQIDKRAAMAGLTRSEMVRADLEYTNIVTQSRFARTV
jgi:predicted DNA binding CopG/RHH family protein